MDDWGRLDQSVPPDLPEPWWRVRRCRDPQDPMESTELRECREILEPKERWEPEETRDPEGWQERMACKVLLVLRGRRGEWETLGSLDSKVRKETKDRLENWDLRVSKEPLVFLGSPVSKEYL